jgi:hypothetical protein
VAGAAALVRECQADGDEIISTYYMQDETNAGEAFILTLADALERIAVSS